MDIIGWETLKLKMVSDPLSTIPGNHIRGVVNRLGRAAKKLSVHWVGLSAPQIGIFKRVFVLRNDNGEFTYCINPEIISKSDETDEMTEYCLSVPILGVNIKRPSKIKVRYWTPNGHLVENEELSGLMARAYQHELDHLNGILITDYLIIKREELDNEQTKEQRSMAPSES